jgi:hypothetical protein
MKHIFIFTLLISFLSCSETKNLTPAETAKVVAQSFFTKDKSALKAHTTEEGYASLVAIQDMIPTPEKEVTVEILDEKKEGENTWVKYSTSYDEKSGIFKLVKENGMWKVTYNGPRDKGPF